MTPAINYVDTSLDISDPSFYHFTEDGTLYIKQTISHSTNHSNWYEKLKKSTLTSNTFNYFIDVGVVAVADCWTGVGLDLK